MTKPPRTCGNQPICDFENSVLESDLDEAFTKNRLKQLEVMETDSGFFVVAQIWLDSDKARYRECYLCTRRERSVPKMFMSLERLNGHLKVAYPGDGFLLKRDQVVPGKIN